MSPAKIALRNRMIAGGGCTRCWYKPATDGFKTCPRCREQFRTYSNRQESKHQEYLRKNASRIHMVKVTKAATKYVTSLRSLERVEKMVDHPELMGETRKQVQSAVRELFRAVEAK